MTLKRLSPAQLDLVEQPLDARIFLEGPAGCGKTSAGVERLLHLMQQGVPGSSILLLAPQRTLAAPYVEALHLPGVVAGGMVTVLTVGGLARRMVELFWPLAAEAAGFSHPDEPPVFLTLETAQYYMAHLVRPLLDEGYFDSITVERNRLYSQIIDNLNKAAVVGFPHSEIGARLKAAYVGSPAQARVYDDAQACANRFRAYCLEHNLLDFSLQVEVFRRQLWQVPLCRQHLLESFRHIIFENIEEDTPVAHDLLAEWLPQLDSALLIYDQQAGYRRFLGADPENALSLRNLCTHQALFDQSFVDSPGVHALGEGLRRVLRGKDLPPAVLPELKPANPPDLALSYPNEIRFYPQMMDWAAGQIAALVNEEGTPPGQIAVLAPFLSDALRFSLASRLQELGIPARSHRPSRSLRDEPAALCLLTLARLAHPNWGDPPARFDVAYALLQSVEGLDLVRAQLLAEIVYRTRQGQGVLLPFDQILPEVQERITYRMGMRYETLRLWLQEYRDGPQEELDIFLSRLFGEVLSQPGFGFHASFSAGAVTANLVESIQKFRWATDRILQADGTPVGREYLLMVEDGVIAAQYIRSWQEQPQEAVFLAPAYTFLMGNRPVDYQFWLDVGSQGWFERLYQPLTHPYVLSRAWPAGRTWNELDEAETGGDALYRLALGLVRRCRRGVFLGISQLGEQGYEQRGPLLRALHRMLVERSA